MKTFTYWLKRFILDVGVAGLFFLWKAHGIEGAGNVVLAYFWIGTILMFFAICSADENDVKKLSPRNGIVRAYLGFTQTVKYVALIWFGHYVLGTLYLFVGITWLARRDELKKKAAAAAAGAPA